MATHVVAMVGFMDAGAEVFDDGHSSAGRRSWPGTPRAFDFPGLVPAYIRPLFCEGKGPFRWVALSGDPEDITTTDERVLEALPDNEPLRSAGSAPKERDRPPGPARPYLLAGAGERAGRPGCSTTWSPAGGQRRRS